MSEEYLAEKIKIGRLFKITDEIIMYVLDGDGGSKTMFLKANEVVLLLEVSETTTPFASKIKLLNKDRILHRNFLLNSVINKLKPLR